MENYITEELSFDISTKENKPLQICHQKHEGIETALLSKIEFESLEVFDVKSLSNILFITENNVQINLNLYKEKQAINEKSVTINLLEIPEFASINIPNWFLLKSGVNARLRGILKVKLCYTKMNKLLRSNNQQYRSEVKLSVVAPGKI